MDYTYVRPDLYPKQTAAFFNASRYSWIEGSTKSGKTVSCIAWLVEQGMVHLAAPGRKFWWVAPVYNQAKIAFDRIRAGLPAGTFKSTESPLTITLPTGSILEFKSAEKPDNLYGDDVWAAVVDEASRMRRESFFALRSTLTATRGPVRIIGNVKGRKNWFYIGCREAEGGKSNHEYHKIIATDAVEAGVLALEEIDDARANLPENVFKELYLCEPSDDGGNPFGISHIRKCVGPLSSRQPVAFGVDLAKSVDWTVTHGLDENGATCVHDRWQSPWIETKRRVLSVIGYTSTLVDCTGVGNPVVEDLQDARGGRGEHSPVQGYTFTPQSKQKLMEGLAIAIQQGSIQYPDGVIVSELESFEYEYTRTGVRYTAPEGMHDDCVMALALAVQAMNNRGPEPQVIVL